jgi:hypothetical protein
MNQIIKFSSHQFQGIAGRSNVQHRILNEKKDEETDICAGRKTVRVFDANYKE